jgi:hypothetical protein
MGEILLKIEPGFTSPLDNLLYPSEENIILKYYIIS